MAEEILKQRHGDRITFWGGGVNTQKTLPFGTPDEVRAEVLRRCEIFSPGGGFVFNTIHNIQAPPRSKTCGHGRGHAVIQRPETRDQKPDRHENDSYLTLAGLLPSLAFAAEIPCFRHGQ